MAKSVKRFIAWLSFAVLCFLLSYTTGADHFADIIRSGNGVKKMVQEYFSVMQVNAIAPYQYRVLVPLVVTASVQAWMKVDPTLIENFDFTLTDGLFKIERTEKATPFTDSISRILTVMWGLRCLVGALVFFLYAVYLRTLNEKWLGVIFGVGMLFWITSLSFYEEDLSVGTWVELALYVAGGIAVVKTKWFWLLPLTILGAFNRESIVLLPFCVLPAALGGTRRQAFKPVLWGAISFVAWVLVFVLLRQVYGWRGYIKPFGNNIGVEMLLFNLSKLSNLNHWVSSFGVLLVLIALTWKGWRLEDKRLFVVLSVGFFVPLLFVGVIGETRIFLVPMMLAAIPGVLGGIRRGKENGEVD